MSKYLIFIVLCGILGAVLGKIAGKNTAEKKIYFSDLLRFCDYLIHDLSYKRSKLKDVFESYVYQSENFQADCKQFLKEFSPPSELFKQLNGEEKAFIGEFFQSLGKVDYDTQRSLLCGLREKIAGKADDYQKKQKKEGSLLVKLGFLFGLCLGVLLI